MGLNDTPSANRLHIGFFGCRNAGKSSLVNAVTGQDLAIVSAVKGTTTDPVYKSMELLPLGPVLIIDTPGIDDEGALGELRIRKAKQALNKTDAAVLALDTTDHSSDAVGLYPVERDMLAVFKAKGVPYIIAWNKCDLKPPPDAFDKSVLAVAIAVSAKTGHNINELKERIGALAVTEAGYHRQPGLFTRENISFLASNTQPPNKPPLRVPVRGCRRVWGC